jgi:hypothetical protein
MERQEINSSDLELGQMAGSCKESNETTTLWKRTLLRRVRPLLISVMSQRNPKFKWTFCMYSHSGSNPFEYSSIQDAFHMTGVQCTLAQGTANRSPN